MQRCLGYLERGEEGAGARSSVFSYEPWPIVGRWTLFSERTTTSRPDKSFHENCQPFCVISKIQKMRVLRNERSVRNERRRYSHVHQTDGHGLALKRLSCFGFFGFGSDSFKSAMTNVAGASAFDGIGIGAIGVSWFCSLMR